MSFRTILLSLLAVCVFVACAPRVDPMFFEQGKTLYEQGEYYKAIQQFAKYPEKHKLHTQAQDYINKSETALQGIINKKLEQAEAAWKDDFCSKSIAILQQCVEIDPRRDDVNQLLVQRQDLLAQEMERTRTAYEMARGDNDILTCKITYEKLKRMAPESPLCQRIQENYLALKDVVLQKAYIIFNDLLKSRKRDATENAMKQVEYMQGIDAEDQRAQLASQKLAEHLEKQEQRKKDAQARQRAEKTKEYLQQGMEAYEQGKLKLALDILQEAQRTGFANKAVRNFLEKTRVEIQELITNYTNQGKFYFDLEDYPKAREMFEKALNLDPDNETAKEYIRQIVTITGGEFPK